MGGGGNWGIGDRPEGQRSPGELSMCHTQGQTFDLSFLKGFAHLAETRVQLVVQLLGGAADTVEVSVTSCFLLIPVWVPWTFPARRLCV